MDFRVFISYAHSDRSDALYVRSVLNAMPPLTKKFEPLTAQDGGNLKQTLQNAVQETVGELTKIVASPSRYVKILKAMYQTGGSSKCVSWMDDDIPPGDDWRALITDRIRQCNAFLVLVPASASTNVATECGIAMSLGKKILPLSRSIEDLYAYNLNQYQAIPWPTKTSQSDERIRSAIVESAKTAAAWGL